MAKRRKGVKARGRYRPRMWEHNPTWRPYRHGGQPWFGFEAAQVLEEVDDDIVSVPLFGHTHGHVGIAIKHADGWLLDAGDAYFDAREVKLSQRHCGPGPELFQMVVTTEYAARRDNQDRLRQLHAQQPEVAMFAAHNPFEYLDLTEANGDPVRGIDPTRRWRDANRPLGAAR